MADRYDHPDGLKAQDITLRGKRLEKARSASMQNEDERLKEKERQRRAGRYEPKGMVAKRNEKVQKAAETMSGGNKQEGVSGYLKPKGKTTAELDEVFK